MRWPQAGQRWTVFRFVRLPSSGQLREAAHVLEDVHVGADGNHGVDAILQFQAADLAGDSAIPEQLC